MKKIVLLLIGIFILTGCSAEYNLTYENNNFKENIKFISIKNDDFVNKVNYNYNRNYFVNYKLELGNTDENEYIKEYGGIYNKGIIDENNMYGLELKYDYDEKDKNFINSSIVHNLFEDFYVSESSITATNVKNIFENYDISEIKIVFSTDKKVVNANYDEEIDGKYYWYINKNNYKDKNINIYLSEMENSLLTNEGYLNGNIIKYILMVLVIIILLSIVVVYEKVKKSNN